MSPVVTSRCSRRPHTSGWCCPREVARRPGTLDHVAFGISDLGARSAWCEHLTDIGIPHEGITSNIAGHSVDLFDPDGNNIEFGL